MPVLVGIFVGGASRRMGGEAKGLLRSPGGGPPLVVRMASLARAARADVILVGEHPAYVGLGLSALADARRGAGPLGGLVALLEHAGRRPAVALSCDLPFVERSLLERLVTEEPEAAVLAPRPGGRWEPLVARYDPTRVRSLARARLERDERSLQALLDAAGARELSLRDGEARMLRDWDSPADVARDTGAAPAAEVGTEETSEKNR